MATKKKDAGEGQEAEGGRKTQKLNVWLTPEQIEWLKNEKGGASVAVRALITEAMNMDNLRKSVSAGKKKRSR